MSTIRLWAFYELGVDGTGATGLTVTVDIDKYHKATGARTRVTTGASATEGANGNYLYDITDVLDAGTFDYVGVFQTANTDVISKHVTAYQPSDPLRALAPGDYSNGTVGYLVGRLATNTIIATTPILDAGGNIRLLVGDDYYAADGQSLDWTNTAWPTLTGGTITLRVKITNTTLTFTGSVTSPQVARIELSRAQIDTIGTGTWRSKLECTLANGHVFTLLKDITVYVEGDI